MGLTIGCMACKAQKGQLFPDEGKKKKKETKETKLCTSLPTHNLFPSDKTYILFSFKQLYINRPKHHKGKNGSYHPVAKKNQTGFY